MTSGLRDEAVQLKRMRARLEQRLLELRRLELTIRGNLVGPGAHGQLSSLALTRRRFEMAIHQLTRLISRLETSGR